MRANFRKEIRILGNLRHPNITTIIGAGVLELDILCPQLEIQDQKYKIDHQFFFMFEIAECESRFTKNQQICSDSFQSLHEERKCLSWS